MTDLMLENNYKAQDTRLGLFKFRHAALGFLLGVFFFPTYFGINLGFDLTILRIFEIVLLVFIYMNKIRRVQFINLFLNCKQNIWIALYFLVVCFTDVIRGFAIKGILYAFFNWILVFYLLYYLIKYEWGVTKFIKYVKIIVTVVCLISILELFIGFPPFSLLDTLGKSGNTGLIRSGSLRISGMCTVANGFGLYLMLLMPICAYDEKLKRIDVLKNGWRVLLVVITAFLTGSRLAVGAAALELILLIIFSPRGIRFKTLLFGSVILTVFASLIFALQEISFFKSILLTFFTAWDEVFDTTISIKFGADMTTFKNSSEYREKLFRAVFYDSWINPLLGQGYENNFSFWYEGTALGSTDNYYVGQYVMYAYPGLVTWILMSLSFVPQMITKYIKRLNRVNIVVFISFVGYYISLWYLDQLQTFPIMMALFALSCVDESKKELYI